VCFRSEGLKRSSTLWKLNLHFERFVVIGYEDVIFSRCDTTDEVLKIPLSRQHLSLSFSDMKITDEGINHFSESLMQMTTLKTINLKFASCHNITHLVMKKMNTSLKSLFALEILKLDFSQTDISNQGLKEVSDGLELLTSLKVLDINFDECKEISDKGLNNIAQNLGKLYNLHELIFRLSWCKETTDKGLKSLSHGLKGLTNLNKTTLMFMG